MDYFEATLCVKFSLLDLCQVGREFSKMYHAAMFPHMVVQVGQQGHYHPLVDSSHRQSRGNSNGSVPLNHYEHGVRTLHNKVSINIIEVMLLCDICLNPSA